MHILFLHYNPYSNFFFQFKRRHNIHLDFVALPITYFNMTYVISRTPVVGASKSLRSGTMLRSVVRNKTDKYKLHRRISCA